MTDVEFNPEATDGDGDGIIQEGTPFERSVVDAEVNPVVEEVAEVVAPEQEVITAPEPAEEAPAIVPVEDGVIGVGKAKKAPKKPAAPAVDAEEKEEKVAVFAKQNLYWNGVGRLSAGYNIVPKSAADKWLTLAKVRPATPEEVKANLG